MNAFSSFRRWLSLATQSLDPKPKRGVRLRVEELEDRCVPSTARIVVGTDAGQVAQVKVFDGATTATLFPFGGFTGGVRVAAGDVTGDGKADYIVAAGPAAGGHIKVYDGASLAEIASFFAYPGFVGGTNVAAGDVNGDGKADIITGTDSGPAHVKVFDGASQNLLAGFIAFPGFFGGVNVAAGDVNGDGKADLIVGTGPGALAHVKVFDGTSGALVASFLPFGGFTGGINVAAGDVNGDGRAEIIVGAASFVSHVKVFDGASPTELFSFLAFPGAPIGVRVAAGDVNGDSRADIITGAVGVPHVKVFDGTSLAVLDSFFAFFPGDPGGLPLPLPDGSIPGGVFVAAATDTDSASPLITSASAMAFTEATAGTFTVTTTGGFPRPVRLSATGALPAGVTFVDQGDGTATLSGAPAPGTASTYSLTITAANGDNSLASVQAFELTINPPITFNLTELPVYTVGEFYSQTILTSGGTGTRAVGYALSGPLPAGLSISPPAPTTDAISISGTATADVTTILTLTAVDDVGATTTITYVLAGNHKPSAGDFTVTATTTATRVPVLAHAFDLDGNTLTVTGVTQGASGTVSINADGTVTYTLTRFFSGIDQFTYTVNDGRGGIATGTVTVQVQVPPSAGIPLVNSQVTNLDLDEGQKNSLVRKLDAANQSLARGDRTATANQLHAIINQVQALKKSSRLDPAAADLLIQEIQALIGLL